jgi:RHS repeat-associated protein
MVEENRSGAYTQIVYTPSGAKLALMNGSTLQKGFVPLTGGSMAVYNSSGLAYYRHSDWAGSSRFASTPSRTMYSDSAYAPFGEPYAQVGTTDSSFTGMNQDTVSNLYDFAAREYGIQGRWPSPDPAGITSVNPTDPQTWNRYAYVRNNPLGLTDPTGMGTNDDDTYCDYSETGEEACGSKCEGPVPMLDCGGYYNSGAGGCKGYGPPDDCDPRYPPATPCSPNLVGCQPNGPVGTCNPAQDAWDCGLGGAGDAPGGTGGSPLSAAAAVASSRKRRHGGCRRKFSFRRSATTS